MTLAIFCVLFLFLLTLPFLPALVELIHPSDSQALSINMDYSKDARYFGNSFKGILKRALGNENAIEGTRVITLSKKETVEILSKTSIPAGYNIDHLMIVTGNLLSHENVTFDKEIYVRGKASIGGQNTLRALAGEGKVSLAPKTRVIRWMDAEGGFTADRSCDLGWSASSGGRLKIGQGCVFRRLYGIPVMTWNADMGIEIKETDPEGDEIGDAAFIIDRDWAVIPPGTTIDKTLIFKQNLRIKRKCLLKQDIKTYKKLVLDEGVRIDGNVFAENGISAGPSVRIFGNVFSQASIHLGRGSKIGRPGTIKSLVARGEIELDEGVVIFGYVVAGKRGRVL